MFGEEKEKTGKEGDSSGMSYKIKIRSRFNKIIQVLASEYCWSALQRHCFTTAAHYAAIIHLERFQRFSMCAKSRTRTNVPFYFVLVRKPLSLLDLSSNISCIWFSRFYLYALHIHIDIHFFLLFICAAFEILARTATKPITYGCRHKRPELMFTQSIFITI